MDWDAHPHEFKPRSPLLNVDDFASWVSRQRADALAAIYDPETDADSVLRLQGAHDAYSAVLERMGRR